MKKTLKYGMAVGVALMAASAAQAAGKNNLVSEAQQRLNSLGYYSGPVDGVMGEKTRLSVMSFQRAYGLPETGTLSPETFSLIGQHYTGRYDSAYYGYYGNSYDARYGRAAYGYAPYAYNSAYYNSAWNGLKPVYGNAYMTSNYYNYGRVLPVRFGRMEVVSNGIAGATDYTVTLNGHTVLQATNQPQPLSISRVHQLGGEDAVIFTAYDGTSGCSYKNYLITVKSDGTYTPAQQVGDCTGRYQARVDGNMLFITFPNDYALNGYGATWRYGNNGLVRL